MNYATYIADHLRPHFRDFKMYREVLDTGDGDKTTFYLPDVPVVDGSETVKVDGVTKTRTTHYTIDYDTGAIVILSAPGDGETISVTYQSCIERDARYVDLIADATRWLRPDFYTEGRDTATIHTVADQEYYDMSTVGDLSRVYGVDYSTDSGVNWKALEFEYSPTDNYIKLTHPIGTAGYDMRIHYLKAFAVGSATSSTISFPDRLYELIKMYVSHLWFLRRVNEKSTADTIVVKNEHGLTPIQILQNTADYYLRLAIKERGAKKLNKPLISIKVN